MLLLGIGKLERVKHNFSRILILPASAGFNGMSNSCILLPDLEEVVCEREGIACRVEEGDCKIYWILPRYPKTWNWSSLSLAHIFCLPGNSDRIQPCCESWLSYVQETISRSEMFANSECLHPPSLKSSRKEDNRFPWLINPHFKSLSPSKNKKCVPVCVHIYEMHEKMTLPC